MNRNKFFLLSLTLILAVGVAWTTGGKVAAAFTANPGPSASGHGSFRSVTGVLRTLSFNARTQRGETRGHFNVYNRGNEHQLKGEIDCLTITGNIAMMSGTITHSSTDEVPVGTYTRFAVQDNGEGEDALPDGMSFFSHGPEKCDAITVLPIAIPVQGGNIQVRP